MVLHKIGLPYRNVVVEQMLREVVKVILKYLLFSIDRRRCNVLKDPLWLRTPNETLSLHDVLE